VESLERYHQTRTVIEDFSSRTLAAIASAVGRLYYVSSLRDSGSGRYVHDGLGSRYSQGAVQEGLTQCHEELFAKILETPLKEQKQDLDKCFSAAGEEAWKVAEDWRENLQFRSLCPEGAPEYLHDLFCSNMNALLAIFASNKPN
jgi:hypothetical protein